MSAAFPLPERSQMIPAEVLSGQWLWDRALACFTREAGASREKFWGYEIVDATGEVYAFRKTYDQAMKAKVDAEDYLDGAATCGHPAAASWVNERLPIVVRPVSQSEREEALDDSTPVLDREP